MAAIGLRILITALACSATSAAKRPRARPAATGPPPHPTFERAHAWAGAQSERWGTRGFTTNFADVGADATIYRS
eukprot:4555390-Pyramimonas_sp.AAC.1